MAKSVFDGLPSSVRVGPYIIHIMVMSFSDDDTWGTYSPATLTVRINDDQPSGVHAVDTVVHELLHAVCRIYILSSADSEERFCSVFATAWTQVLLDNPKLSKWIDGVLAASR